MEFFFELGKILGIRNFVLDIVFEYERVSEEVGFVGKYGLFTWIAEYM